jgi:hypothetical protein
MSSPTETRRRPRGWCVVSLLVGLYVVVAAAGLAAAH